MPTRLADGLGLGSRPTTGREHDHSTKVDSPRSVPRLEHAVLVPPRPC